MFSYWNQVEFHFGDKVIPHTTIAKTISHVVVDSYRTIR